MAKWSGKVGFMQTDRMAPGVHGETIVVRKYRGDVMKETSAWKQIGSQMNPDLTINNRISIVADPYANYNYSTIRWVSWMGQKWKVTSVEVQRPRLILSIGGVYTDETNPEEDEDDYG